MAASEAQRSATDLEEKGIEDAPLADLLDAGLSCGPCRSSRVTEGVEHMRRRASHGREL